MIQYNYSRVFLILFVSYFPLKRRYYLVSKEDESGLKQFKSICPLLFFLIVNWVEVNWLNFYFGAEIRETATNKSYLMTVGSVQKDLMLSREGFQTLDYTFKICECFSLAVT